MYLIIIITVILGVLVLYFFARKKEREYFKSRFDRVALLSFDIGRKIDRFEEYRDRFLYIHQQLDEIQQCKPKDGIERLDALEENVKHIKLDIEAKESLS